MRPAKAEIELFAVRREVAFEFRFDSKILYLGGESSLTLNAPHPGNAALVNHARDMVRLGFKSWKGTVEYGRLHKGCRENGTVEKTVIPSLWKVRGRELNKKRGEGTYKRLIDNTTHPNRISASDYEAFKALEYGT